MGIVSWIIFGLIVGMVANALDSNPQNSRLGSAVLLGVMGATFGGFFANLLFGMGVSGFSVPSFLIAVGGSLLLLFGARTIQRA